MSLSRSAKAALLQAEAEGLTLLRSESSSSGFRDVKIEHNSKGKTYRAQVSRDGKRVSLGSFATAEEAALCVARTPEAQAAAAAPPAPPPMTAAEAVRQAKAEGLTLMRSESSSGGFRGVSIDHNSKSKPYMAYVRRDGKSVHLGHFATAEEAALCVPRTPEAQAAAAAPPVPPPLTAEEAVRQAKAEGLTLMRSESSSSGFRGVSIDLRRNQSNPYKAHARRDGKRIHLGSFATAEEAALCVARASAAQTASPQPPAASSRKRKVKEEEQPPEMPAGARVKLEELPTMPPDARVKLEWES